MHAAAWEGDVDAVHGAAPGCPRPTAQSAAACGRLPIASAYMRRITANCSRSARAAGPLRRSACVVPSNRRRWWLDPLTGRAGRLLRVHQHRRAHLSAEVLGAAHVVGVRVRQHYRIDVRGRLAEEFQGPQQQVPVPRPAGVHQGHAIPSRAMHQFAFLPPATHTPGPTSRIRTSMTATSGRDATGRSAPWGRAFQPDSGPERSPLQASLVGPGDCLQIVGAGRRFTHHARRT